MVDPVADLLGFIDRAPTPFHAVAETTRRLRDAGFRELSPADAWDLSPGDRRYVERGGGSLVAFQIGSVSPADGGFRVIGAHTDSPNLRIKPLADVDAHGYRQLAIETYGGVLLHTWLDRDLSLAGRVLLRDDDGPRPVLLDFGRPLLRVPSLAIHLCREIRTDGLKLNPQTELVPLLGLEDAPALAELVTAELRAQNLAEAAPDDLLGFDLMAYDVQPAARAGARGGAGRPLEGIIFPRDPYGPRGPPLGPGATPKASFVEWRRPPLHGGGCGGPPGPCGGPPDP